MKHYYLRDRQPKSKFVKKRLSRTLKYEVQSGPGDSPSVILPLLYVFKIIPFVNTPL